jgi:hypothetical protein
MSSADCSPQNVNCSAQRGVILYAGAEQGSQAVSMEAGRTKGDLIQPGPFGVEVQVVVPGESDGSERMLGLPRESTKG